MKRYTTRPITVWAILNDGTREAVQEIAAFMTEGGGRAYRREGELYLALPGGGETHMPLGAYLLARPDHATTTVATSVVDGEEFEVTYQLLVDQS